VTTKRLYWFHVIGAGVGETSRQNVQCIPGVFDTREWDSDGPRF
jgi:hypothetical protein